eukprot:TRINITY_DN1179_c0_g1_i1.p1 TRINITY_DN1179_c0_g1~~TRINITY_DN1179_c0_g1_i1.p1  ORF type:complete len:301 (-),score=52.52 TRINITY_DN1179_c0_g1_i1:81-866(-)
MTAFALTASTTTLLRRTPLLPATTSVRAFLSRAASAARRRSRAPAPWGATTVRAMADGVKAPASVTLSDDEWRTKLTPEQFRILRQKGTEMGGTGEYDKFQPPEGFFKCAACENPLYSAESKFNSGCGWPAFDKCYKGAVKTETDVSYGMKRVEIMCNACGGHLGHVFEGERFTATNERHCVNSVSVKYDKATPPGWRRPRSSRFDCGWPHLDLVVAPVSVDVATCRGGVGSAEVGLVDLALGRTQASVFSCSSPFGSSFF